MSDAACDLNSNNSLVAAATRGNSSSSASAILIVEDHWRKGIILVQIWREVLRVILFAGKPGEGLDETSKREMWLLLVAAGSGYLARCWHKTLKPNPQLTDHPNDDDNDSQRSHNPLGEEASRSTNNLFTSSSPASQPLPQGETGDTATPLDAASIRKTPELAPKPLRRNFSPKALGKKLFSSESSKTGKALRKQSSGGHRSSASGDGERDSSRWIGSARVERSLSHDATPSVAQTGTGNRRSPWSSFRSHSSGKASAREGSPGVPENDDDSSTESSPGCLKLAGDSFRKSRRRTDSGSLSSRSLQGLLGGDLGDGGPPSAGSSRREIDLPDSVYSSSGLTNRSLSSLGAASAAPESSDPSGEPKESPEVTSRRKAVANEAKPSTKSSSPDMVIHDTRSSSSSTIPKDASLNSVAAVVARIEKGNLAEKGNFAEKGSLASAKAETVNAILSLRAANEAHARAQALSQGGAQAVAVSDIVKARNLKVEVPDQDSVEEAEILPGGKGKRRAGDVGGKVSGGVADIGMGADHSAPLSTGKRTKDSKDSSKSESSGVTLTSITNKWMKDASFVPRDVGVFDEPSSSSGLGAVDLSQVFFGFDSNFLVSPTQEKSPFRFYRRSRQLSRSGRGSIRKMRESPRPVSALESCLRAQFPERENEVSRVARSLNFSSIADNQRGQQSDSRFDIRFLKDVSNSDSPGSSSDERGGQSPQQTEGALGLPLLATPQSRGSTSLGRVGSSDRGAWQLAECASKYPRKVVYEDRGRVVPSQSNLSDVLVRPATLPVAIKKRKVSQACSPAANSTHLQTKGYEFEALVIPPMEGLLFCFGVGIGVMSLIDGPDDKVERLNRELQKSQEKIESLNNMLSQERESSIVQSTASLSKEIVVADRDSSEKAPASLSKEIIVADRFSSETVVADRFSGEEIVTVEVSSNNLSLQSESPLDPLSVTPAIEEQERQFEVYRREAPETPQQTEHMAELEAELEAELDALTSSITDAASGPPDFEELDPEGVAGVADRDLGIEGLPAVVDWDDDNDDFITEEHSHTGGGVPPRELSRLLRKVQNSRQEHRIAELEADLQETVEKLQAVERELQLLTETRSSFVPSAGTGAESPKSVGRGASESPAHSDDSSWSSQIERLNQSVFEDQESRREEINQSSVEQDSNSKESPQKSTGERSAPSTPSRDDNESNVLGSVASEPAFSMKGLVENDPAPSPLPLVARAISEPISGHRGQAGTDIRVSGARESTSGPQDPMSSSPSKELIPHGVLVVPSKTGLGMQTSASSMILTEEAMNCETQSDNDAVCDEFLSSVFASPDGSQMGLSSVMSSPLVDQMPLSTTPEETNSGQTVLSKELALDTMASAVGEDLDQVVGQLLKRDSSSVKNAINAFLRWEAAETDEAQSKDDVAEEEIAPGGYSRRTAGKNPTPQKTPILSAVSSSVAPQKSSVISSRLEHLARSAFTSEKMPHVEKKPSGSARRLGLVVEEKSPAGKTAEVFQHQKTIDVFQPQPSQPKLEERSPKPVALWEYPVPKKEHNSPTRRRGESGKGETSMADTLRDLFRGESPVFGGGDRDFQALLDTRRELRYSSSKVQLSLTGPDTGPVFRPREEPGRAGTNSPVSTRPPVRNAFQSPKIKHSRMALENRLYQNPTSDWLAEVGSPPDLE